LQADEIRVATWNVHEGFTPEKIHARSHHFAAYAAKVRPDVLVMEEITSYDAAVAVRDAMGLKGYYVACSNFNPTDEPDFGAFEVGILSRFPIDRTVEYDATPDNGAGPHEPPELPIEPLVKLGLERPADTAGVRGFLWARIPALRLTVVGVHLKSSRGNDGSEDLSNAAKREFVVAAVAGSVAEDLRLFPDYTCLVGGDFNVGHADPKNGRDLARDDVTTTATSDGYDETHALLRDGLVGVRMRNLGEAIRETTFPGINSTPIDNLYVAGARADSFAPALLERETYGSDHRSVVSVWTTTPAPVEQTSSPAGGTMPKTKLPPTTLPPSSASTEIVKPADAAKHLNGLCTIELEVRAANVQSGAQPIGFLNSEADFRSPDNFTIVVFSDALEKFRAAGVADFAAHFQGKKIRVTGQVTERRERLQIVVADPKQIEIVR
jgi:endonuclease/exonuclease/phosphatase family metal-dependent hydrolase